MDKEAVISSLIKLGCKYDQAVNIYNLYYCANELDDLINYITEKRVIDNERNG